MGFASYQDIEEVIRKETREGILQSPSTPPLPSLALLELTLLFTFEQESRKRGVSFTTTELRDMYRAAFDEAITIATTESLAQYHPRAEYMASLMVECMARPD